MKKYNTIHQHQPLKVPDKWDGQERLMVQQLEDILDDIYRRFGRLRFEDFSDDFRERVEQGEVDVETLISAVVQMSSDLETAEGNITTLQGLVTALGVTTSGISLVGKYLKLLTGSKLQYNSYPIDLDEFLLSIKNGVMKGEHYTTHGNPLLSTEDIVVSTEPPEEVDGRIWIKPTNSVVVNYFEEIDTPTDVNNFTGTLTTEEDTNASGTYSYRLRFPVYTESASTITVTVGSLTFTQSMSAHTSMFDQTITDLSWYGDQDDLNISMSGNGKILPGGIELIASSYSSAGWDDCTVKIYKG